jgi:hypothetical protein
MLLRRSPRKSDIEDMQWWMWPIVVIWGPGVVLTALALVHVVINRIKRRLVPAPPVLVERRRPDHAFLRKVVDDRPAKAVAARRRPAGPAFEAPRAGAPSRPAQQGEHGLRGVG